MIYPVGKYFLHLPDGHMLPKYQQSDLLYDKGFMPLLSIVLQESSGWFVDVGANVGDTACLVATISKRTPILCIEGSEAFIPYLRRNIEQIDTKVEVLDGFLKVKEIDDLCLGYLGNDNTGGFVKSNFNKIDFIENKYYTFDNLNEITEGDISVFKTDTDGLDLFIVKDFLNSNIKTANSTIINMEFSPIDNITDKKYVENFLLFLENKNYCVAIFDNRGAPIIFSKNLKSSMIMDLMNYIEFSKSSSVQPYHYLDLWLFPQGKQKVFQKVEGAYRSREAM
jgi:hypothetical protein